MMWILAVAIGLYALAPAFKPLSREEKEIRQMMRDHPNPHMRVVGRGTVKMDPKAIRESASFKESVRRVREYSRN